MGGRHASDVRIWADGGAYAVGVGFLIGPRHIMTCAHVAAAALGDPAAATRDEPPGGEILLDFLMEATPGARRLRGAWVVAWRARGAPTAPDDVAILELTEAEPEGARPIKVHPNPTSGEPFEALAVREGMAEPTLVGGTFHGPVLASRSNVTAASPDKAIQRGCSGGAAWTSDGQGVLGMVVEGHGAASGSIIPIDLLARFYAQALEGSIAVADVARSPTVILIRIDPGTRFPEAAITSRIVRAFAEGTDTLTAPMLVLEAGQLVREVTIPPEEEEHAFILQLSELPPPEGRGLQHYWGTAFRHAYMLGPRMVAALLLVAPPSVKNRAETEIRELLVKLERG